MRFTEFGTGVLMPVSNEERTLIRKFKESDGSIEQSKLDSRDAELAFQLVGRGVLVSEEKDDKITYSLRSENALTEGITFSGVQSQPDIADAVRVYHGYCYNVGGILDEKEIIPAKIHGLASPHKFQNIPLSQITIHKDWGRRPENSKQAKTPIIVLQMPDGKYIVLDGQHRVLAKKEQNKKSIYASVIQVTWKPSYRSRGRQNFLVVD